MEGVHESSGTVWSGKDGARTEAGQDDSDRKDIQKFIRDCEASSTRRNRIIFIIEALHEPTQKRQYLVVACLPIC